MIGASARPVQTVLDRLERVKVTPNGWRACCPGPNHDGGDRKPSLDIREGDDGVVLFDCKSGHCHVADICEALDLRIVDLFPRDWHKTNGTRWHRRLRPKRLDLTDLLANAKPDWGASTAALSKLLEGVQACAADGCFLPDAPREGAIRARIIA